MPRIQVAFFDMAATTVDDMVEKPGLEGKLPLVISAYGDAFRKGKIELSFEELNACRGRDKISIAECASNSYLSSKSWIF